MRIGRLAKSVIIVQILLTISLFTLARSYDNGFTRSHISCVTIPDDLKLCHDVGYKLMVLPNLLRHETLHEVKQQASSFVPLVKQDCHKHAKIFLCSLFAPVCLIEDNSAVQGAIPPCQSFCRSVKNQCLPLMQDYTFDWPAMLNCSQYTDDDPCVKVNETDSTPSPHPTLPSKREFFCWFLTIYSNVS